jgi:hypothetical protein
MEVTEKTCKGTKLSVQRTENQDRRRSITWAHGVHSHTQHVQRKQYFLPTGNSELPDSPGSWLLPFCKHSIHHLQNFNCFRTANIAPPQIIHSPLPFTIQNRSEYILLTSLRLPLRPLSITRLIIDMLSLKLYIGDFTEIRRPNSSFDSNQKKRK